MSGFTVQYMLGDQALVSGTDKAGNTGRTIVSTVEWTEIKGDVAFRNAVEDSDAKIREFLQPILDAVEAVEAAVQPKQQNPLSYVVRTEAVEGVAEVEEELIPLSLDSIILRVIEEDRTDLLLWVDVSTLSVLDES